MTTNKLTKPQEEALVRMEPGEWYSAYELEYELYVEREMINALYDMGLLSRRVTKDKPVPFVLFRKDRIKKYS